MDLRTLARAWNDFFFRPQPVVGLALFRIVWGLLLLGNFAILASSLFPWFGVHGVVPLAGAREILPGPRLNVLAWLPQTDAWMVAFFSVVVAATVAMTLGVATRLATVVVFVGLVTLHHRAPLILNGGDTVLRTVTFLLIFAPAGRALSLERLWRVYRGREPAGVPVAAPWAQRLIQAQVALMYLATFCWKAHGETWVDGTALYYATRLVEFHRFPVPLLFDHLWIMKLLTWATLLVEFALGVLIWVRQLRYPVLLGGVALHLGIEYAMNIPLFEWIAIAGLSTFVEPADAQRAVERLKARLRWRGVRLPLAYDGRCAFCLRVIAVVRLLDALGRFELVDGHDPAAARRWPDLAARWTAREMLLRLEDGRWVGGFDAFRAVLTRLPLGVALAPWLHLPGVPAVGRAAYGWVARNRLRLAGVACYGDACLVGAPSERRAG